MGSFSLLLGVSLLGLIISQIYIQINSFVSGNQHISLYLVTQKCSYLSISLSLLLGSFFLSFVGFFLSSVRFFLSSVGFFLSSVRFFLSSVRFFLSSVGFFLSSVRFFSPGVIQINSFVSGNQHISLYLVTQKYSYLRNYHTIAFCSIVKILIDF